MLRLRLTCLALATGFVFTLSGCYSMCEDGRLFPRLFNHCSRSGPTKNGDCECQNGSAPWNGPMPGPMMDPAIGKGPILMPGTPDSTVPIIRNVPPSQPPQVFKVPTAPSTPYVPSN
jgi:hypothetical protein